MDIFTPEKRSAIMSGIRGKKTKPEEAAFRVLRAALGKGRRIERHVAALPGTPDLFVPSLRLAVFVHGCFWHCCPRHGQKPASNSRYWLPKLEANIRRDRRDRRRLNRLGIAAWTIWEHDLTRSRLARLEEKIGRRLRARAADLAGQ